ncbi:ABC transporter permease [Natronosporangium hydrolyticum]|uniref:ABC transporter permease n=1 Tax=Natronosporangium hydrolyticum TaxID=2811111 RepID=A0A895YRL2_9ACTN|nr:ABC transporter permease [Natronosporangium hydrolyticum]QSB16658.1 ABC transporter permease [Natronosporangium hydrolyticum]
MRLAGAIGARVAVAAATLAILSAIVFWATEVLPGDAVGVVSGPDATEAEREAVRVALGLDRPAAQRYGDWVAGVFRGDLGTSLVTGRDVAEIVTTRFGASLAVVLPAAALMLLLAGGLGTAAGIRAGGRLDRALTGTTLGLIGTPDFLIATALLVVFTLWWPVLPAVAIVPIGQSLWQHPELVALPALALALGGFGATMRLLRASVAQTVATPFAEFARLNGVRGHRYVWTVVSNALGPAIQTFTLMTAGLLGGAIVVETLFNVPGLGYELTRSVGSRDVPLVQGLSLVLGAATLTILLTGDIAARLLHRHATAPARPA